MEIKIIKDNAISNEEASFYTVVCNGETIFECMSAKEVRELTIAEIEVAYVEAER